MLSPSYASARISVTVLCYPGVNDALFRVIVHCSVCSETTHVDIYSVLGLNVLHECVNSGGTGDYDFAVIPGRCS